MRERGGCIFFRGGGVYNAREKCKSHKRHSKTNLNNKFHSNPAMRKCSKPGGNLWEGDRIRVGWEQARFHISDFPRSGQFPFPPNLIPEQKKLTISEHFF